jgi:glycosyltransferase involved in cell wall biosynthesis
MRILQIHNKYKIPGGEDVLFLAEHDLLVENGHTVEKLYFDNKNISETWLSKLKTGIQCIFNLSSAKIVQKTITRFKPDIIHVQNFYPLLSPSVFFVANWNCVPIIATINNYRLICASAILYRNQHVCEDCVKKKFPIHGVVHKCYHNSAIQSAAVTLMSSIHKVLGTWKKRVDMYIIAMTDYGKDIFISSSLNLPKEKCVVKPNFVFDPGQLEQNRENYYVFFARLAEEKGLKILIDSLTHFSYPIVIIGDGPLRHLAEEATKKYPQASFLGFQNLEYIMNKIKKAKAVIMPSTWYEALPLSVLHSLSAGTPVIISDLPPFQELITDGYNGLHFKTGSAIDLAEKIKNFDNNYDLMRPMHKNARETYIQKYTAKKNYEMLINIYEGVLANYKFKKL